MAEETHRSTKATERLVREGDFVAEVDRLDDVREALRSGDLRRASQLASGVYKLTPVTA
jgi:hypothetical protein